MNKLITIAMLGLSLGLNNSNAVLSSELYVPDFPITNRERVITAINPYALVTNAYQGKYNKYGIPGFAVFRSGVRRNKITAEQLVIAGFMDYRYTFDEMMDEDIIKDIDNALKTFIDNSD